MLALGLKFGTASPENLRNIPKHAFNKQIHKLLLLDLQRQDYFADIDYPGTRLRIGEERKKIIGKQSEPRGSLGWGRAAETKHKANPTLMRFAWRTETMVLPDQLITK